jgi:aspartyl aminopeptidase
MFISDSITNFLSFLENSPTSWHAVEVISKALLKANFIELNENETWTVHPGGKYFVTRNGSSICAFITPIHSPKKAIILGAHTDSPALKLKPNCEYRIQNYVMWGVEIYGGPLLNSWLNRDLGLAGRIVYRNEKSTLSTQLVCIKDHPVIIPQLAIHLDREVNDKGLCLNRQDHLSAIAALSTNLTDDYHYLNELLKKECPHKILGADLFLFPLQQPGLGGHEQQLISSYRLDNLASTHSCLEALLNSHEPAPHTIKMAVIWDNEEIGSNTSQGAASPFLNDTLERMGTHLQLKPEEMYQLRANSLCVAVDLAHAVHPNYPTKHEPHHQPRLDGGIVIKFNASQRYATDAISGAAIANLCELYGIPYQKFVNRTDMHCGTTIGPLNASRTGIRTVDIGCPQLSMHSTREMISCKDQEAMNSLLTILLQQEAVL